jgi:hypothetical protein
MFSAKCAGSEVPVISNVSSHSASSHARPTCAGVASSSVATACTVGSSVTFAAGDGGPEREIWHPCHAVLATGLEHGSGVALEQVVKVLGADDAGGQGMLELVRRYVG